MTSQFTTIGQDNNYAAAFACRCIKANDKEVIAGGYSKSVIITDYPTTCSDTWSRYKASFIGKHTTVTDTRNQIDDFITLDYVKDALTEYVDDNTVGCYDCEERLWEHDRQYVNECGNTICEYCRDQNYDTCDDCHDLVHHDDAVTDEHDTCLCGSCYRSNYSTCTCCNRIVPDSEINEDQCEDCYEPPSELERPDPPRHEMFLATHRNGKAIRSELPPIGIELEFYADSDTDVANDDIDKFFSRFNRQVDQILTDEDPTLKLADRSWLTSDEDGSLHHHPNGIEIISRPLRIETWRKLFLNPEVGHRYDAMVYRTTRKTGLHISIPADLGPALMPRVVYIFNVLCRHFDSDATASIKWIGREPSDYSNNSPLSNYKIKGQIKYGNSKHGSMTVRNQPKAYGSTIAERLGRLEFRAPRTPESFDELGKRIERFSTMLLFCSQPIPNLYTMKPEDLYNELERFKATYTPPRPARTRKAKAKAKD